MEDWSANKFNVGFIMLSIGILVKIIKVESNLKAELKGINISINEIGKIISRSEFKFFKYRVINSFLI